MERAWIIASGLCLIVAAGFLWRANLDAAFVAATLGIVAWFLNMRARLRKTIIAADDRSREAESDDQVGDQDED